MKLYHNVFCMKDRLVGYIYKVEFEYNKIIKQTYYHRLVSSENIRLLRYVIIVKSHYNVNL